MQRRVIVGTAVVLFVSAIGTTSCGRARFLSQTPPPAPPVSCDVEALQEQTVDTFIEATNAETTLAGIYRSCTPCHTGTGNSFDGGGVGWGVFEDPEKSGDELNAEWHTAVIHLAANNAASPRAAHTLWTHFDGSGSSDHPSNPTALALLEAFHDDFDGSGGQGCAEVAPPLTEFCEDTDALVTALDAQQIVAQLNQCAACHRGAAATPEGDKDEWGLNLATTPEEWNEAFVGLARRDPNRLLSAFDGVLYDVHGSHPLDENGLARVNAWLSTFTDPDCGLAAPTPDVVAPDVVAPDVVAPEPEPELECDLEWPAAERDAYFETHLQERFRSCSICHTNPAFAAQNGGVEFSRDATLEAALASLGEGAASDSPIGRIMGLSGSTPWPNHFARPADQDFVNGNAELQTAVDTWVTQAVEGIRSDAPECNVTYRQVTPAESLAYFEAELYDSYISCGSCHTNGQRDGDVEFNSVAEAHAVGLQFMELDVLPRETTIGIIMRVDGTERPFHVHGFGPSFQGKEWILMHQRGVPED